MRYKVRGRTLDEFMINEEIVSGARTVTEADLVALLYRQGFTPINN